MAASKEGIARARRIAKYNEDTLGLNAAREKPLSYCVNAFEPNMKARNTHRSPNKLHGCRVRLDPNGQLR